MFITLVKQKSEGKERRRKYTQETVSMPQELNRCLLRVSDRLIAGDKGMTKGSTCTEKDHVILW